MPLSCGKRLNKNEYSSSFMNFIHAIEGFVPIAGFFNFQKKQEFPIRSIFEKTINKTKEKSGPITLLHFPPSEQKRKAFSGPLS